MKEELKITSKNTKTDIMKAYNELLSKYEERATKVADKKAEVKVATDKAIVEKAISYTVENIVKGLAELKLDIGKSLTELTEQLTQEANKLEEIKQAISIETKQLQEIHDIRISADTLADLISAQEERKRKFESNMTEQEETFKEDIAHRKAQWVKEQKEHELIEKENEAKLKKERAREKEEYDYNLTLTRKKDKDSYEAKKAELKNELETKKLVQEKELSEREAVITVKEKELAEYKAKVEQFPDEFSEAVKNAEKQAVIMTENKAKTEAKLLAKEIEGNKKLAELKVSSLEDIITKQNTQIQLLTEQLNAATMQAQEIAVKVIEGNSNTNALTKVNEIALEQAKNMNIKK